MPLQDEADQIRALAAQGNTPEQIAAAVGVELGDVESVLGGGQEPFPGGGGGGSGAQGPQGPAGPPGPQGPAGPDGPQGPKGDVGDIGATGAAGPQGPKGDVGAVGPGGPEGATGATGPAGSQGPQGDIGPSGAVGPAGPKGDTGAAGADGATGPAGAQGPQGDVGPTGAQGPAGVGGAQGPTGSTGPTGPNPSYGTAANEPAGTDKLLYVRTDDGDDSASTALWQYESGAYVRVGAAAKHASRHAPGGADPLLNVPTFQAATLYPAGYVIQQGGVLYARNALGTSGASFAADSANWTVLGSSSELGYAEITAGSPASPYVNTTSTKTTLTGLTVTATVGARPISVEVDIAVQVITANQTVGNVYLLEDGTVVDSRPFNFPAGAQFGGGGVRFSTRRTPAAGSHTYTLQGDTSIAANSWWALGSTTSPKSRISVVQR